MYTPSHVYSFPTTFVLEVFPSAEQLRPKSGKTMQSKIISDPRSFTSAPNKSAQTPDKKAGLGVWPAARKHFFVLSFWLLLGQAKSN
jgi:hypothetical protein